MTGIACGFSILLGVIVTLNMCPGFHGWRTGQMLNNYHVNHHGHLETNKSLWGPLLLNNEQSLRYMLAKVYLQQIGSGTERELEKGKLLMNGNGRRKHLLENKRELQRQSGLGKHKGDRHYKHDWQLHKVNGNGATSSTMVDTFFGMRGKKRPIHSDGFIGMRGKKYADDDGTYAAYIWKHLSPDVFYGMRGKKDDNCDASYKNYNKRNPKDGFLGMRGKKLKWRHQPQTPSWD